MLTLLLSLAHSQSVPRNLVWHRFSPSPTQMLIIRLVMRQKWGGVSLSSVWSNRSHDLMAWMAPPQCSFTSLGCLTTTATVSSAKLISFTSCGMQRPKTSSYMMFHSRGLNSQFWGILAFRPSRTRKASPRGNWLNESSSQRDPIFDIKKACQVFSGASIAEL